MPHKPKQSGERHGKRIDLSRTAERTYWCAHFGISPEELRHIVREVGPIVSDVRRRLRRGLKEAGR